MDPSLKVKFLSVLVLLKLETASRRSCHTTTTERLKAPAKIPRGDLRQWTIWRSDSRRAAKLALEKGASSWLTALPLDRHGFRLHKGAFRDALSLRYNWAPSRLPSTCVCGKHFSVAHALSCRTGGYAIMRHNELRDITARLMQEVCYDASTEP